MTYMGSKRRYAKDITPFIQRFIDENNITTFIDCFCGGANLIDKIQCENLIGNDLSPTLISLHKQAQEDFLKIPTEGSREYWDKAYTDWKTIKNQLMLDKTNEFKYSNVEMQLFEIGAIEWYASFSNGGFPRGYAKPSAGRDYYKEAYRNHKAQSEQENYKKIVFTQGDYRKIEVKPNSNTLLYCDSPYKGTKPYAIDSKFDFNAYYNWLREMSHICPIFISEQEMPDDFIPIWHKETKRTAGKDNNFKACETLYFIDNRDTLIKKEIVDF